MKQRVHVAGAGIITAIGTSLAETFESLQREQTGIGPITLFETIQQGVLPVGEVKLSNHQLAQKGSSSAHLTRTSLLGIRAVREAMKESFVTGWDGWRTGLISATTVGGMDKTENFFRDFLADQKKGRLRDVVNHSCGQSTRQIAEAAGEWDFVSTINTACSSSVNSIIYGVRLIEQGLLDVVVAGGADSLTRFTVNGFNSLMILDKNPCRPFDAGRNGLNLGEGAGFLVLVSEHVLQQERLRSRCTIAGYANTNDAFHQTASSPEGRGSFDAMQKSLAMSGLDADEIDYLNLHGTGTLNNDQSEGTAVKRLFGGHLPRMSSTKAFTGHTLGASGGVEAVLSVMALENQCVFPNLRFNEPMPELDIVPQLKFESGVNLKNVMSNSFGFGGNCSSIIFSAT